MSKLILDYETIVADINCLCQNYSHETVEDTVDCILSVGRNGLFLAHHLSYYLGIKDVVNISMENNDGCVKYITDIESVAEMVAGRNLIVADMVLDTGKTIEKLMRVLFPLCDCDLLFVYDKMEHNLKHRYYFGRQVGNRWIQFPWEKNETVNLGTD